MKTDQFNKVMLCIIAVLLFLNLLSGLFSLKPATAAPAGPVNRFQISAWASPAGAYGHHSGYYVLNTITGEVVSKREDFHNVPPTEQIKPLEH